MKLLHDIENDLEYTIPPEGGEDSHRLFQAMTERSLALLGVGGGMRVVDLACGMGQDAVDVARRMERHQAGNGGPGNGSANGGSASKNASPAGVALAVEPSDRMIRFAQQQRRQGSTEGIVRFVRALGEEIPLADGSVDAVLCKGSLDHFMDPARTMEEIARILGPGGRVVISLANYDSFSCRLGRAGDRIKGWLTPGFRPPAHPYYEPPPDHLTRFGYRAIRDLPRPPLRLQRVEGLSMLWGYPPWGRLLAGLPAPLRRWFLTLAFALGRWWPAGADVIVIQAVREGGES